MANRDIAPSLLEQIERDFRKSIEGNPIYKKIRGGKATYADCAVFSKESGEALAKAFQDALSPDILPDGKLYRNIAERVIRTPMMENYDIVADVCWQTQQILNQSAGIGLKAVRPERNDDYIGMIIDRVSGADRFDGIASYLHDSVVNFSQKIVDDSVRANAGSQHDAGMSPKIVRTAKGKTCEWCMRLAGTYDYADVKNTGNDIWRRHRNCDCLIEYVPRKGKRETVYNYRGLNNPAQKAIIEKRKQTGQREMDARRVIQQRIADGTYSLNLSRQKYDEHVQGTPQYANTAKTRGQEPSRLAISYEECQRLVSLYSGTGKVKTANSGQVLNVEFVSTGKVVGQVQNTDGEWVDTRRFAIHHGQGGSHIVPVMEE